MEMEDKESTDTGSLGGNSEIESPPVSSVGGAGVVVPQVMNMNVSMGNGGGVVVPPAGGVVGSGGGGASGGGGNGDTAGKKRGRPRKYDADGNLSVKYLAKQSSRAASGAGGGPAGGGGNGGGGGVQSPTGFSFSSPSSAEFSSSKKGRGRQGSGSGAGSGNWQLLASLGELFANTAGTDFTPHVVTVHTGEDVAAKILSLTQKGPRGLCVLSANGTISNVTIRQPGSSGGLLTYEGRFEILSLTGSYAFAENGGMKTRTGGLSVTLAGPDGRVVGGAVAGVLLAATPIQMVIGSFIPYGYKMQKKKHQPEHKMAPVVNNITYTTTAAAPISQVVPQSNNVYPTQPSQLPVPQGHGEADNNISYKENPNSTSTDSADYNNNSGPNLVDQRPSPDINVSVYMD